MTAEIQIVVNGEARHVPAGLGVPGLLSHLGLPANRVAIERNNLKAVAGQREAAIHARAGI